MSYELPPSLKSLSHFVKIGNEYASRDVVVYYWCLYRAMQEGMKMDKSSPGALNFLTDTLSILERIKSENAGVEALTQDIVAQAHIEDQAQRLFNYAESQDSASIFNMKVVKAFYTSGYLFDVLDLFGVPDDNIRSAKKYAKWRSTYIFNCLKTGKQAVPGNQMNLENDGGDLSANSVAGLTADLKNIGFGRSETPVGAGGPTHSGTTFPSYSPSNQPHPHEAGYGFGSQNPSSSSSVAASDGYTSQSIGYSFRQLPDASAYGQHHVAVPGAYEQYTGGAYGQQPGEQPHLMPIQTPAIPPSPQLDTSRTGDAPTMEEMTQAKKFVKYALSALDYDDAKTAVVNMQKALVILQK